MSDANTSNEITPSEMTSEEIKKIDARFSEGSMSEHDVENLIRWARQYGDYIQSREAERATEAQHIAAMHKAVAAVLPEFPDFMPDHEHRFACLYQKFRKFYEAYSDALKDHSGEVTDMVATEGMKMGSEWTGKCRFCESRYSTRWELEDHEKSHRTPEGMKSADYWAIGLAAACNEAMRANAQADNETFLEVVKAIQNDTIAASGRG